VRLSIGEDTADRGLADDAGDAADLHDS